MQFCILISNGHGHMGLPILPVFFVFLIEHSRKGNPFLTGSANCGVGGTPPFITFRSELEGKYYSK